MIVKIVGAENRGIVLARVLPTKCFFAIYSCLKRHARRLNRPVGAKMALFSASKKHVV
jgi:hypothetical protein